MNPKFALQQFLEDKVLAAPPDSPLADVQVRAAKGETSKKPHTVALISDGFSLSPNAQGELEYYDANLYAVVFVKVVGQQPNSPPARAIAESQLDELVRAISQCVFQDHTLGGRVFDARVMGVDFEEEEKTGERYLLAPIFIVANEASRFVDNR